MDLAQLQGWIGRSEEASDLLTPRLATALLATIGDTAPDLKEGTEAPLAVHWCLFPPTVAMQELGEDGHPARGGFLPPVPLPRRMWAGGELILHDRLRVGDRVTRRSTISDMSLKEGRSGRLCFVTVAHEIATERGLAVSERQDIVYRDGSPAITAPVAPVSRPVAAWSRTLQADPVLLFRYSALTFNGHRIHYDRPYATMTEGYPGLVVHGPLQATLLLDLAGSIRGGLMPSVFAFRGVRPLFDGGALQVNASKDGDGLRLWTAGPDGEPAMEAKASW